MAPTAASLEALSKLRQLNPVTDCLKNLLAYPNEDRLI